LAAAAAAAAAAEGTGTGPSWFVPSFDLGVRERFQE